MTSARPVVDNAQLLQAARQAFRAGQKARARELVQLAARQDPGDYRAWLWLASLAGTPAAARAYLDKAEALRPGDPVVARARAWAERQAGATAVVDPPPKPLTSQPPTGDENRPTPRPNAADAPATMPAPAPAPAPRRWARPATLAAAAGAFLVVLVLGALAMVWIALALTGPAAEAEPAALSAAVHRPEPAAVVADTAGDRGGAAVADVAPAPGAGGSAVIAPRSTPFVPAKEIAAKGAGDAQPRPTWTVTPRPTQTPPPPPTLAPTFVAPVNNIQRPAIVSVTERWIDIDLSEQRLVAYEGNTPVFQTLVSSGLWRWPTVIGQFRIYLRFESQTMNGYALGYDYYLENVPHVQYFFEDYALHGAYWHNNFGQPMSHGCVNLSPADAAWLFNWASIGTLVNVHE